MKLNKPKFWDIKNSFFSILLFPLSLVLLLFIFLKKKFTKILKFNIPIICVGNIYVGGTGKTPASILLANELLKSGRKPVILRKYYKNHTDEYNFIKENFKNLIVSQNRVAGIKKAENIGYDTVILDDGFQDYKIKKNAAIICFNGNQLIGNGYILPAGPLRESINSLKNANIVLINGKKNNKFEDIILNINRNLDIFYSYYKPINIDKFKNRKLLALAGIGNPENFFQLMKENNLNVEKKLIFPDHYKFNKNEIKDILEEAKSKNYQIIMTEKDFFKIKEFNIFGVEYLKVSLEINEKNRFIKKLTKIYDQKI